MEHIYIAFVDTPGILATFIHLALKQKYIHVAISMDAELKEAYSIGRRHPMVPVLAGFEREDKKKIHRAFPTADYMVCEMDCTKEQKAGLRQRLRQDYRIRFRYHYAVLGLFFILLNRPFYQKNHYTCSSYLAKILQEQEIVISQKHFSLVTPKDFYEYENKKIIFEGSLREMVSGETEEKSMSGKKELYHMPEALYEQ